MEYTAKLPTEVGLYRHRWDFRGQMREQVLFVGYTNARAPRLQGSEPNAYMPRKLKCCKPDEHLHADRLTPKEWGGWWARIETPNDQVQPTAPLLAQVGSNGGLCGNGSEVGAGGTAVDKAPDFHAELTMAVFYRELAT